MIVVTCLAPALVVSHHQHHIRAGCRQSSLLKDKSKMETHELKDNQTHVKEQVFHFSCPQCIIHAPSGLVQIFKTTLLLGLLILAFPTAMAAPAKWQQSYDAGYLDGEGQWAGGSEIMHLAAHKGKLYAANGYWLDARWVIPPDGQKQSAQVLRLDQPNGKWQVDLDLGKANDLGLQYMKGNILKSVTFTRDKQGRPLKTPVQLLSLIHI